MPRITLVRRQTVAEGTSAFWFSKPAGLSFKAGQAADWTLAGAGVDEGDRSRTFSIASAPHESELMFATRMSDRGFKKILASAKPGLEVDIEGISGKLILHEDAKKPSVFLTGGIGITPVRSILLDAAERRLSHNLYFFYGNHTPEDAAFLGELTD